MSLSHAMVCCVRPLWYVKNSCPRGLQWFMYHSVSGWQIIGNSIKSIDIEKDKKKKIDASLIITHPGSWLP